ncbi:Phosphatidylglycerol/phosphatidylinositol transfer protein [Penicillium taxi]|uniref:Phosphatidylglycerol/phosphatidylinositol transfer protein n=1 Tax=Penicillium taxi TaxID=168475 RepID=UPI0025451A4F|nr:Phosphatidylglycerol/phosphatidylinositol transfer protein [Penicillium taxi]KAJ5907649.1 Phosphatidylglycerol/phosphatidylinositol transfer protein [Penicillium taxi]
MKLLSAATLLLVAAPISTSAAAFRSIFDPSQAPIHVETTQDFPVQGDNPLKYCADPKEHVLQIDSVDLSPNPPKAGEKLTIKASGTLNQAVEEGAYVNLEVKWGVITLIKQTVNLCDQISNVDLSCPLDKGKLTFTKDVELPKQIPPGKYSVLADVYTPENTQVTCLKADNIEFKLQL